MSRDVARARCFTPFSITHSGFHEYSVVELDENRSFGVSAYRGAPQVAPATCRLLRTGAIVAGTFTIADPSNIRTFVEDPMIVSCLACV